MILVLLPCLRDVPEMIVEADTHVSYVGCDFIRANATRQNTRLDWRGTPLNKYTVNYTEVYQGIYGARYLIPVNAES